MFVAAARELHEHQGAPRTIPPAHFSALAGADDAHVTVRGAVLVRVRGAGSAPSEGKSPASPELIAALHEPKARPLREVVRMLRDDGILAPALIGFATIVAAAGVLVQTLMLRGFFDLGRRLATWEQRLAAIAAFVVLCAILIGLELPIISQMLRMGRRLEARLRIAFLSKIPRLGDRYLRSRATSDMAERAHALHRVRELPMLGFRLMRSTADVILLTAGLIWLDPHGAPIVLGASLIAVALPWTSHSILTEKDLRVQSYQGALARFYLDALVGAIAIRAHTAERAMPSLPTCVRQRPARSLV